MPDRDVEPRRCCFQGQPVSSAPAWGVSLLAALVLLSACTRENVTSVVVASVTVSPPSVSAFDGEEVQLAATVRDDQGAPVSGAPVQWSSDDRSVVTVDVDGAARALAVGTTTVRASFQDVSGSATFVVLRAPRLAVSEDSVTLYAGAGGADSDPAVLEVTNDGGGVVAQLGVTVVYPAGGPADWLDITLAASALPTELALFARPGGLPIGRYPATLVLTAEEASNSPVSVPVTLSLTGLRVTESGGGTSVTEGGGSDGLTVVLALAPASTVEVDVVSGDPAEVRVSPARLTFERGSWDQPQTVTVTGFDDPLIDGDQITAITLFLRDGSGQGPAAAVVQVRTVDDDEASLTIVERGGSTTVGESGATDDFTVVLGAQPTSDVVLRLSSGDPGEVTLAPASLRFTPAGWNDPRTVTLTGVDDDVIDGDQVSDVTLSVDAAASDDAFDALGDRDVRVTTLDLDAAGLTISASGGGTSVTEAGSYDRFTVALSAGPTSDVVLNVASDDTGEVTVQPATLRFTPASWKDPQAVIVTGVDDGIDDGDVGTDVRLAVDDAASNDAFDALASGSERVTTTDNDGYGITVTESDGATLLTEFGGQDIITVVLDQEPWLSNVVIVVSSADAGEVTLTPTRLTFTPTDWSVPRTVILTGVDDPAVDGDQATLVTVEVDDGASDLFYSFVPGRTVTAITSDDDGASTSPSPGSQR